MQAALLSKQPTTNQTAKQLQSWLSVRIYNHVKCSAPSIPHKLRTSPVTSLDNEGSADSRIAEIMINDAVLDAQLQGHATSRFPKEYTPDATTGEILLAKDYVQVELLEPIFTNNPAFPNVLITIAQRDGRLFNVTEQTFDFSSFDAVKLMLEEMLEWDNLTVQQQREIIAIASMRYQLQQSGDPQIAKQLAQETNLFRAQARANDIGRRHSSIFGAPGPARGAVSREQYGWGFNNARYPNF